MKPGVAQPWAEEHLQLIAKEALRAAGGEAEVALSAVTTALTRFANNRIHQNVQERDLKLRVRVARGSRIGVAETNDLSEMGIRRAAERAGELAEVQAEDPDFLGFPSQVPFEALDGLPVGSLGFTPADRAATVAPICEGSAKAGLTAAGAFTTGITQWVVANTEGLWAHHARSLADYQAVVMGEGGSGWASNAHLDASALDGSALGREAIEKALRAKDPGDLEPGNYAVVLEPYATLDLLQYLALGFSGDEIVEGRSFATDADGKLRLGERLLPEALNLVDDGLCLEGLPQPFDAEGLPRSRVPLVQAGAIAGAVFDRKAAKKAGCGSTGHALAGADFFGGGSYPAHLSMPAGTQSLDELIGGCERGIYVTRFHYTNRLDSRRTLLTGMTRDGTFLIEKGKIVRPLRNLRFTQSIVEALNSLEAIGRDTRLEVNWFDGGNRAPAVRLGRFHFSGRTTFG